MTRFTYHADSVSSPARSICELSPRAAALEEAAMAVYIGIGSDLSIRATDDGAPILLRNVPAGTLLPIRVSQVYENGTTADAIVALL